MDGAGLDDRRGPNYSCDPKGIAYRQRADRLARVEVLYSIAIRAIDYQVTREPGGGGN